MEDVCKPVDILEKKVPHVKELLENFGEELDEDRLDGTPNSLARRSTASARLSARFKKKDIRIIAIWNEKEPTMATDHIELLKRRDATVVFSFVFVV